MLRRYAVCMASGLLWVLLGCGGEEATMDGGRVDVDAVAADETPSDSVLPSSTTPTPDDSTVQRELDAPSASADDELSDTSAPEADSTSDAQAPDPVGGESEDRWATTPLAQYWDEADAGSAEWWDRVLARQLESAEAVATCMAEQGFEYIPFVAPLHPAIVASIAGVEELSDEEFREQYGYGISTRTAQASDYVEFEVDDPNIAIQAAMGAAEREAFNRAMGGDEASITESTPLEERGCGGRAQLETRTLEETLLEELDGERRQLQQRIDNDPRVVQAELEWSRCMSQAGYAYGSRDDIFEDLNRRAAPFQGLDDPYQWLTQAEIDALSPEELDAVVAELSALPPEQQAVLDALQALEIAVAAADHECGIALDDVRYQVTVELEQQFVDEHLAELEAIIAARRE